MSRQYAWVLVAGLALAGCGGGGGGGGSSGGGDSGDPGVTVNQVTTDQLTGTWVRTVLTRDTNGLWVGTTHDTIVITRTNSSTVRLKDCVEDSALQNWTLANNALGREGEVSLQVASGGDFMEGTKEDSSGKITYIFKKTENSTGSNLAGGSLSIDLGGYALDATSFNQVCVATQITPDAENSIKIRANGTPDYPAAVVNLEFRFDSAIEEQTYGYNGNVPSDTTIEAKLVYSLLANVRLDRPDGSMTITKDTNKVTLWMNGINFALNPAVSGITNTTVDGEIYFHPDWLQGDPNQ